MSYYILDKISTYFGFFIIALLSFTAFNKNLRMRIKNKLKKFSFLYYGSLFALFVLSGNLSHYFNEKQLFLDLPVFKSEFLKLHDINERFFKIYLLNFEEPIRMELMSKMDPLVAVFDASFERYAKDTGKSANDIKTRYENYIKGSSTELKEGLAKLREEVLPLYNVYKLPFQNNNPTAIEVDRDGNIIPIVNDLNGQAKELLYYNSNYELVPFTNYNRKEVFFNLVKNEENNYFKEVLSVYYLDENNVRIPIDYYKESIDTSPYYIDLKENKDSYLKSIKIKAEYSAYITKKAQMQELVQKDKLNEFKDLIAKNNIFTLNTIFSDGNPAFTYALITKSKNTLNYFLENEFNINLKDKDLKTAFHNAVISGYDIEFLKKLIEKGANLTVKDAFGKYAIDYAKTESDIHKYLSNIPK